MSRSDIILMKKYKHILAAMIDRSLGYFTPTRALDALIAYKKSAPWACEWYLDMAGLGRTKNLFEITDEELIKINKDVIRAAIQCRKYRTEGIKTCKTIVESNIAGNKSIFASYF